MFKLMHIVWIAWNWSPSFKWAECPSSSILRIFFVPFLFFFFVRLLVCPFSCVLVSCFGGEFLLNQLCSKPDTFLCLLEWQKNDSKNVRSPIVLDTWRRGLARSAPSKDLPIIHSKQLIAYTCVIISINPRGILKQKPSDKWSPIFRPFFDGVGSVGNLG